jgi:hypothetical protein
MAPRVKSDNGKWILKKDIDIPRHTHMYRTTTKVRCPEGKVLG